MEPSLTLLYSAQKANYMMNTVKGSIPLDDNCMKIKERQKLNIEILHN